MAARSKVMVRVLIGMFVVAAMMGCGDPKCGHKCDGTSPDAQGVDLAARCPSGHGDKIKFAQQSSCANDGGVEFCVPDNDSGVLSTLAAVSTAITCAPGGGRAGCSNSQGLLLCSYPTAFP